MKKLAKMKINQEKILGNEELLKLKGGGFSWSCYVGCHDYTEYGFPMSTAYPEQWYAEMSCIAFFDPQFGPCNCMCDPA